MITGWGLYALVAGMLACLLALAVMKAWPAISSAVGRKPKGMAFFAVAAVVMAAYAADKPDVELVKGVALEPVELTSTNATVRWAVKDSSDAHVAITNRSATVYRKSVDGMWKAVLFIDHEATGKDFINVIDGFFIGEDSEWRVVVDGQDGEAEP